MSTHDWPKITRFVTLTVLSALSLNLGQASAAHAGSITDKVKSAFVSTGEAIKKTAQAGGAAVVYTGKAVGTTAGAVAGATGELVTGSAKALETSSEATVNATGDLLGMRHKQAAKADSDEAKTAAATTAAAQTTNATADGAASANSASASHVVRQVQPVRAAVQAPLPAGVNASGSSTQARVTTTTKGIMAPLPKGNSTSVSSAVARGTLNGTDTNAASVNQVQTSSVTAAGAASAALRQAGKQAKSGQNDSAAMPQVQPVKQAQIKPAKQPKVQTQPQGQSPVARVPLTPNSSAVGSLTPANSSNAASSANAALDAAAMEVVRAQTGQNVPGAASGKGAPSAKVSKHMREEMLKAGTGKGGADASEMSAAQELQALAPAQISNDITEGTRISAPVEDSYVAPSWNQQQPVTTSAAFAQQYSLHTTPLKPAATPGQAAK